jgi:hypothetical protein
VGASNLFGIAPLFNKDIEGGDRLGQAWNNDVLMVFGGPFIGRLAYIQLIYELDKR